MHAKRTYKRIRFTRKCHVKMKMMGKQACQNIRKKREVSLR